jgi:hypothetical protein
LRMCRSGMPLLCSLLLWCVQRLFTLVPKPFSLTVIPSLTKPALACPVLDTGYPIRGNPVFLNRILAGVHPVLNIWEGNGSFDALMPHFVGLYTNCQLKRFSLKFQEDDLRNCYFTFLCIGNTLKNKVFFSIKI